MALIISFLLLAACSSHLAADTASQDSVKQIATGEFALALPEPNTARAAARILSDGGNAIDGAVTAAFTLAVTFPEAGNIGGGGFLLMQMNGQTHFLDYRETAPAAASRDMYLEPDGSVNPRNSLIGVRAAGVPGYRVEPHAFVFGDVQLVARRNGRLTAASDRRGIGLAIVSQP